MFTFPNINPIAVSIAGIDIYWYGLMYGIGFFAFWGLGNIRARNPASKIKPQEVGDILFYGMLGAVIGGRIGYVLFYNFKFFISDWTVIFRIWEGGMSFHGGLLGILLAIGLFSYRHKKSYLQLLDFITPLIPIGLGAGRIGNFINGELWGRVTDVSWGVIFPHVDMLQRHPSQLYEALLEGLLIFVILWWYSSKPRSTGSIAGLFAILYSVVRFSVEFTREPDAHIGFIADTWMTIGQLLTIPLFIFGVILMLRAKYKMKATN